MGWGNMIDSSVVDHIITYPSLALTTFMVVYKGLPKFLELYIASQESLRKDLLHRIVSLEELLASERAECAEKIDRLWARIEKMRLLVVKYMVVKTDANSPTAGQPIQSNLNRAYGDGDTELPADIHDLLAELQVPFDSTDTGDGLGIVPLPKSTSPAVASEAKGGPKV